MAKAPDTSGKVIPEGAGKTSFLFHTAPGEESFPQFPFLFPQNNVEKISAWS